MASGGNEHRMVFDIRGKRRHVVKVVYAILALLMGASLFLVTGAVNLGSLFGTTNGGTSNGAAVLEEQAERFEHKLVKSPEDPDLLLGLTNARINAANSLAEQNPETGEIQLTTDSRHQLELASANWSEYLKATDEPSAGGAQKVAPALFSLAQISQSLPEAEANIRAAAKAQGIVAQQRPNLNSLSTLSLYKYYSLDFAGAKKAEAEARTFTHSKFEREKLETQLQEISKTSHKIQKQLQEASKASTGAGKESLENPLGGLGGTGLSE
jgi:hypothetical protein